MYETGRLPQATVSPEYPSAMASNSFLFLLLSTHRLGRGSCSHSDTQVSI